MKKFFKRTLGISSVLILGYQQFCYADVISTSPTEILFVPLTFLVGFIGVIILIISAISFFSLKATVKKQNTPGYDNEKLSTLSLEEIEKKKNKIQRRFYVWGMIVAIIGLIYLGLSNEISEVLFFIPIILFIVSFIVRLNKNKKVSNIICVVSVALVCLMGVWSGVSNKMIEDYNKQFLQYQKSESSHWSSQRYVSDVEGLINTAIENNKSGRKTTFIYKNINYTSPEELKQLLNKLNINKSYSLNIQYDKNYDYIETITLTSYINQFLRDLEQYLRGSQRGSMVKSLIQLARNKVDYYDDIEINIVYISETGQNTTINLNTDNSETITNLSNDIKAAKTYDVYLLEESNDVWNIIITSNN